MGWLKEDIAAHWRSEGKRHAAEINKYVRIGIESNWQEEQEEPKEDSRSKLAEEVIAIIRGANAAGEIDRLRQEVPPESSLIAYEFKEKLQAVKPVAFMKNGSVLVYTGSGFMYLVDQKTIKKLPELYYAGVSPDGNYLALVYQQGIRIVYEWGSELEEEISFYPWKDIQMKMKEAIPHFNSLADEEHPEASLDEVIPFADGKQLLLVSEYGIYLVGN